jgi:molybdopterin converting factor small subunit
MRITVKLFASLREKLPDSPNGVTETVLPDGASIQDLLEAFEIEDKMAQMLLVNGQQAPRRREQRTRRPLEDGDVVSIFPPVAGG